MVGGLHHRTPATFRSFARRNTSSISLRPTAAFWEFGSTVMGPTPAMVPFSHRKLLPTTRPSASATTE
jgi:hypothetical protein